MHDPLIKISHTEAVRNIRMNPAAYWASVAERGYGQMFSPDLAAFPVIPIEAPVYAIGSCFAHEVEKALLLAGVPCLSAVEDGPLLTRHSTLRYNTGSMALEFERCLGGVDKLPMLGEQDALGLIN